MTRKLDAMPQPNTPQPIHGDECLLPGGSRVVVAPAQGWPPPAKQPTSEASWWVASLGTSFMLGVMLCLLVVAVTFRVAGARLVLRGRNVPAVVQPAQQPDMLEPAMAAGDVREGPGGSGEAAK